MTRRGLVAAVFVLVGLTGVASAKLLFCPDGRFEIAGDGTGLAGVVLRLGDGGMVELEGRCAPAAARGRWVTNGWHGRFAVRFDVCEAVAGVRARLEDDCDALRGVVRTRAGGRTTFRATRIAVCGDAVVSSGEDCDDANTGIGDCCDACRAEPGCYIPCERTADCAPQAVCERYDDRCRATTGTCKPRYRDQCPDGGHFAVCGCDGNAYATECAAWEAGVTVQGGDGLNFPVGKRCRCRPDVGLRCRNGRFCETPFDCTGIVRPQIGGICTDTPTACASGLGPFVCGCDGRTYENDCERKQARVQVQCVCFDGAPGVGVPCGIRRVRPFGCDCSGNVDALTAGPAATRPE